MKKSAALLLALCVLLTPVLAAASIPAAAAESFTDVPGDYWGKSYIDDMTDRGLFQGYSDGTFRPNSNISLLESLVLLSRLCVAETDVKVQVLADHNTFLSELLNGKGYNWAYTNLAICLETGIVTSEELDDFADAGALSEAVTKEQLAVFLIRAMQLEEETLSLTSYPLSYDDYLFITYSKRPYVYMLSQKGVVLGDLANKFNPKSYVSRAVTSTMLSRAISYMESNNIVMKITRYAEFETYGTIAEINSGSVLVREFDGTMIHRSIPSAAAITVDGVAAQLTATSVGKLATFIWSKEDLALTAVEIDTKTAVVQGSVKSVFLETNPGKVYVTALDTGVISNYPFGAAPALYYNDAETTKTQLATNNYITLLLQNNAITAAYTYPGTYNLGVTLESITFGDPIKLNVSDGTVEAYEIRLDPDALPAITKGGTATTVDKLKSGDQLTITYTNCVLSKIAAELQTASVSGTITRIVKDSTGNVLTISDNTGKEISYTLASDVEVYQNTARLTLDSLTIGSTVSLVISDGYVTTIQASVLASSTGTVTGTVLFVNKSESTILLQVTNSVGTTSQLTVKVFAATRMLVASTGYFAYLTDLKIYDTVDVYGSYDGDQFKSTIIIIR